MNTPLNLNKIRKERGRTSRRARADENAVQFGQTKAQKEALKARAELISRKLDGHKKET
ncbi:DUF4169 family protein [uncultured Sulfitobacter sp.]|uniref:DUF4169 family protein n=1 Tax=uncultured Sulfitobacter sp. TaxID=191468 RepID=UPI002638612A|nr:DUF4169 family protein [uncultured Sulfitobacter sp.]